MNYWNTYKYKANSLLYILIRLYKNFIPNLGQHVFAFSIYPAISVLFIQDFIDKIILGLLNKNVP